MEPNQTWHAVQLVLNEYTKQLGHKVCVDLKQLLLGEALILLLCISFLLRWTYPDLFFIIFVFSYELSCQQDANSDHGSRR